MRGMIVRVTTDRFVSAGVRRGAIGGTLYRADDGRWRLSCEGGHVDADEADFEVIESALGPRGVVLPSLNGGWLGFTPLGRRILGTGYVRDAAEKWGREPDHEDFLGSLTLTVPGESIGFPVLWDRARQLELVYFLETADRLTSTFPRDYTLEWPDPDFQIEGMVTVDAARGWARKAAEVTVTLRDARNGRHVAADLVLPASTCAIAGRWLADLFPAVTTDDLDWI